MFCTFIIIIFTRNRRKIKLVKKLQN